MTDEDRRADELRQEHLRAHNVAGLPWHQLQPAEQERWRNATRCTQS